MNVWLWVLVAFLAYMVIGMSVILYRLSWDTEGYIKIIREAAQSDNWFVLVLYGSLLACVLSYLWPIVVYDWIRAKIVKS